MNFHIISCGWFINTDDAFHCVSRNVESVLRQTFERWCHYIVMDGGGTVDREALLRQKCTDERQERLMPNARRGMARNIYETLQRIVGSPHDVVVMLDLDDRFAVDTALSTLAIEYDDSECWVTHGSFKKLSCGTTRLNRPLKAGTPIRAQSWRLSHCKTFRLGLGKLLTPRDFKDNSNRWVDAASDLALMYPLAEMAGPERVRFVPEVIYEYNDLNPLNDERNLYAEQKRITRQLVRKPAKKRIEAFDERCQMRFNPFWYLPQMNVKG